MTAPTVAPQVQDCTFCDGRGVLIAERVPSGADLAVGLTVVDVRTLRCPSCDGKGAHLVPGVETPEAVPPAGLMTPPGGTATATDRFGVGLVIE